MKIGDTVKLRFAGSDDKYTALIVGETKSEGRPLWVINVPTHPHLNGAWFNKLPSVEGDRFYNIGNMTAWIEVTK